MSSEMMASHTWVIRFQSFIVLFRRHFFLWITTTLLASLCVLIAVWIHAPILREHCQGNFTLVLNTGKSEAPQILPIENTNEFQDALEHWRQGVGFLTPSFVTYVPGTATIKGDRLRLRFLGKRIVIETSANMNGVSTQWERSCTSDDFEFLEFVLQRTSGVIRLPNKFEMIKED